MASTDPKVLFTSASYAKATSEEVVNGRIIGVTDKNALVYELDGQKHVVTSGNDITVDSALSDTSENPVQNKVINTALGNKADTTALTDGSVTKVGTESVGSATNPVYLNAGVPTAITGPIPVNLGGTGSDSVDTTPTEGSTKMVTSGGVYTALQNVEIDVDSAPTEDSTNAVSSGGVYTALEGKQNNLTFDTTPTENSTNPVTSGGVYAAIRDGGVDITIDDEIDSTSENPVQNKVIYNALEAKQDTLTFDSAPTSNSTNPVTSGGVYTYVNNAIAGNKDVDISIAATVPTAAPANPETTIYIVLVAAGEDEGNLYDEYIWVNSVRAWEKLGTQEVDLSGYQKLLTAGDNITISTASNGATVSASHPNITTSDDTTSTVSPALGGTFDVVSAVTRDTDGHVTTLNTATVTLPTYTQGTNITIDNGEISASHGAVATVADTTSTATPSAGGTISVVDAVTRDAHGHVTTINTKDVTLPNEAATLSTARNLTTDLESETAASFNGSADASLGVTGILPVSHGGTGQASVDTTPTADSAKMVTSGGVFTALSGKQDTILAGTNITINDDGKTINSVHPTIGSPTNTTSTVEPDFGETFTVIDSITTDSNGHVTAINTKTVTIPAMYWVTSS